MGSYPSGIAGCSAIFPFQASEKGSVTQGPPCIIVVGNAGMLPLNDLEVSNLAMIIGVKTNVPLLAPVPPSGYE